MVFKKGMIPWSKGLTKETDERILRISESKKGKVFTNEHKKKLSNSHKGKIPYIQTEETKKKISLARKGIIFSQEHRDNLSKSHIGNKSHLGIKHSLEAREKLRLSHLGKKQSLEKINKRIKRGSEHYNWQGGLTPLTRRRTKGIEWKRIADEVRLRDNNTCRNCGLIRENKLPVHHIIPFRISKDNSLSNLITLCNHCHKVFEDKVKDLGYQDLSRKLVDNNPIQVKLRGLQC